MTFFWDWATWAKLTFAFGCSIAIVLTIACAVKFLRSRHIHSHTLSTTEQRAERGETTLVVRHYDDPLFGIRAMDEDPEVDGLWNSRTATPLLTPVPSPSYRNRESSPLRHAFDKITHTRRGSSLSSMSKLDIGEAERSKPPGDKDDWITALTNTETGLTHEGYMSTVKPHTKSSRSHEINIEADSVATWSAYPRLSEFEQSTSCNILASAPSVDDTLFKPDRSWETQVRKGRTFIIGRPSSEDAVNMIRTPSTLRNLEVLDRMEAHRKHHAAESGQLQPRTPRTVNGNITRSNTSISDSDDSGQISPRSVSWPMSAEEVIISRKIPQKPQRRVSPPVIPFRAFVEMHPPPASCPSAWTGQTQELVDKAVQADIRAVAKANTRRIDSLNIGAATSSIESKPVTSCYDTQQHKADDRPRVLLTSTLLDCGSTEATDPQTTDLGERSNEDRRQPAKLRKTRRSRSQDSQTSSGCRRDRKENLRTTIL